MDISFISLGLALGCAIAIFAIPFFKADKNSSGRTKEFLKEELHHAIPKKQKA